MIISTISSIIRRSLGLPWLSGTCWVCLVGPGANGRSMEVPCEPRRAPLSPASRGVYSGPARPRLHSGWPCRPFIGHPRRAAGSPGRAEDGTGAPPGHRNRDSHLPGGASDGLRGLPEASPRGFGGTSRTPMATWWFPGAPGGALPHVALPMGSARPSGATSF